jgi:hypothetical protein
VEGILRAEEVNVNLVELKSLRSWMQEDESNWEACESSKGCLKQMKVVAKIKVQVEFVLDQLS